MMFGSLDVAVLVLYGVAILAVGLSAGRHEGTTHEFFLGGRRQHWLAVGMSIIATEVSALTFINVPADSFRGDWTYLQMYAGSFIGRLLIVYLLLPAFYGSAVTTVYEYLGGRFGPWTRTTASLMFFTSRIVGSGLRLLAASLAIATLFGWPLTWVVVGVAGIAVAYTTVGGIKAIIWTDVVQASVFLASGTAAVVFLMFAIPGNWAESMSAAYDVGKLNVFTWDGNPNNEHAFWVLLIHATFFNMAALGTDQDLTQRMLTCPDLRRGQRSLLFNAFAGFPIVCLFLFIGSLLYAYFQSSGTPLPADVAAQKDRIFPYFIAQILPAGWGLKGLLVAGVLAAAMSSLDSALGALSSTAVTDFYRPLNAWRRRRAASRARAAGAGASPDEPPSETHVLVVARAFTFAFGVLLAAVALAFAGQDKLLWEVFRWVGLIFGGMLGIFLLAVTTKGRGRDRFNPVAMLSSVVLLVGLEAYQGITGEIHIAWPWYVVLGTTWTYLLAACMPTGPKLLDRLSGQD